MLWFGVLRSSTDLVRCTSIFRPTQVVRATNAYIAD